MNDQFVIHRLRTNPVEYTVTISHFVSGGEWQMGVKVQDVGEDDTNRERVAADLRHAAEMLEQNANPPEVDSKDDDVSEIEKSAFIDEAGMLHGGVVHRPATSFERDWFSALTASLSREAALREALNAAAQRLNENGVGELSLLNTISETHAIIRQALAA